MSETMPDIKFIKLSGQKKMNFSQRYIKSKTHYNFPVRNVKLKAILNHINGNIN